MLDHRDGYVYLFSAACPETGAAVGHACARANTAEMNRHLRDVSAQTPAGKHALIVLDGVGWQGSKDHEVPANVSPLRLPPYSPELNPVETLFSVLKHRHFANRVFEDAEHVRETVEEVWNRFTRKTGEIMQITARERGGAVTFGAASIRDYFVGLVSVKQVGTFGSRHETAS